MTSALPTEQKDLVVVVADKDAEMAMRGLLARPERLGIRTVTYSPVKLKFDTETPRRCHDYLRPYLKLASYALVLFDREGCGFDDSREQIETRVEQKLGQNGWHDRCATIAIEPELEAWVWSDSPHVANALGWSAGQSQLKDWLVQKGHLQPGQTKPARPKEALEAVLRSAQKRRSSAIYEELAQNVGFEQCSDTAFLKLRATLVGWFPAQ